MTHQQRGTLSLCLAAFIAMVAILSFGFRAMDTAKACRVPEVQSRYPGIVLSARNFVTPGDRGDR